MIDRASGAIAFDRGTVSPESAVKTFVRSRLGRGAELVVEHARFRTYRVAGPLRLDGRPVAADVGFVDGAIRTVRVCLVDEGATWEETSPARERARRTEHTAWVRTTLEGRGPRWQLPWGTVESEYDRKGGGSAIVVTYGAATRGAT